MGRILLRAAFLQYMGGLFFTGRLLEMGWSEESDLADDLKNARAAVLYTVAYLYEHREEADHRGLMLTLRALLFGVRREGF